MSGTESPAPALASSLQQPTSASPHSGHVQEARPRRVSSLQVQALCLCSLSFPAALPALPTLGHSVLACSPPLPPRCTWPGPSLGPARPVCLLNSWVWNSDTLCFRVSLSNGIHGFSRPGTCTFISGSRVCALRPPPGSPSSGSTQRLPGSTHEAALTALKWSKCSVQLPKKRTSLPPLRLTCGELTPRVKHGLVPGPHRE